MPWSAARPPTSGSSAATCRKATDIGHHLNVLEDSCLLRREPDVFHPSRSVYRVREPLLSLGEVKWGKKMGPGHSARLRRARELLAAKKFDVRDTVLACYSGVGFDGELSSEGDVRAVGLGELYR